MTDESSTGTDYPYVEVIIRERMRLPEGTSKQEALQAAKKSFSEPPAGRDAEIEFRYVDARGDQSDE